MEEHKEIFTKEQDLWRVLGNLLLLRFILPCILMQNTDRFKSHQIRRNAVILSKMIQQIVNQVCFSSSFLSLTTNGLKQILFGGKEHYLSVANNFVSQHLPVMSKFLLDISVNPTKLLPQLTLYFIGKVEPSKEKDAHFFFILSEEEILDNIQILEKCILATKS